MDQPDLQPGLRPAGGQPTGVVMRIGGSSTDQPILFHIHGGRVPVAVVKAPMIIEERASTKHEADVLTQLATAPTSVDGVPRPVPIIGADRLSAWGQTFAPGHTLAQLSSPGRLDRHAALATEWTVNLAMATSNTMTPETRSSIDRAVEHAVLGLVDLPDGERLARSVASSYERIECDQSVRNHGDLGPWNVHLDCDGAITVIDWADSHPVGLPLGDLVHFIAHLCLCAYDAYDPHRRTGIIDQIMDPATSLGRLMVDQSTIYAKRLGLSPRAIDDLRTVTWALDLLGRPSYRWADELYLELLRAEVRRQTPAP